MEMVNLEEIIKIRNEQNPFARLIGAKTTLLKEGYCEAELTVTKDSLNPVGSVHGGALFSLADYAAGGAVQSYGVKCVTIDSSILYLRAAINIDKIIAKASVLKKGKSVSFVSVSLYDTDKNHLCECNFTFKY